MDVVEIRNGRAHHKGAFRHGPEGGAGRVAVLHPGHGPSHFSGQLLGAPRYRERMLPADATPHRRDDGEPVGWILPAGDAWTAIDLLGRTVVADVDWLDAEAALEAHGIAYLADPWMLEGEGPTPLRVRMVEVTPSRILVKVDDYGDVARAAPRFELPWPLPARLRPPRPGDPDPHVF